MSSTFATENSPIPIAKMVNDLFLQWLSLPDTRSTLIAALNSAQTNSKMPDPIVYSKVYTSRSGGFSKSQHFESPPVSPVPRTPSSPRTGSLSNLLLGENNANTSSRSDEIRQRVSKRVSTSVGVDNTPTTNQSPTPIEKASSHQVTKSEIISSSTAAPTNSTATRSPSKVSFKDTPSRQVQNVSATSPVLDQTPLKPSIVISSPSQTSYNTTTVPSIAPVKPSTPSSEQPNRSQSIPSSLTTPTTAEPLTTTTPTKVKAEGKPKPIAVIPKFYFPEKQKAKQAMEDPNTLLSQLKKVQEELFLPKHDKLQCEDFGKVAKLIGLSLYWKAALFRACVHDFLGPKATINANTTVNYSQFESFWKKVCKTNYDNALKFIYLLTHSSPSATATSRNYLTVEDWDYLIQDIIDTHPGLKFLREAREFHTRYIKTVVARVFYTCNRSWSTKLTVQELRRSDFLQTLDRLEQEDDINKIHDYFSYEHFYVIYCKFWDIDTDHDLFVSREDLAKHCNGAISNKMIDRIFSGAVSNSQNMKEGKMSYYEFVWFLISEEDKCSPTSIEYWFRCMDLDGDGILSMYELEYFYQEQIHKMEIYGIEYMSFDDCICQMLDLVKPEEENKIRLKDLKRCKLANIFFDTFFNLDKYLANEQKDPFSNLKDPDTPEMSDWVKYAELEYDNLTQEDGANDDDIDDENYDEDFEEDDEGADDAKKKKTTGSPAASSPKTSSTANIKSDDLEGELKRWKD